MENIGKARRLLATTVVAFGMLLVASNASALDAAYSRKGPFGGFGLGGGISLLGGTELTTLGDLGITAQVGVGAKDKITIALNFDGRLDISSDAVVGVFVPGPQFTFFVVENFYIYATVGLAIASSNEFGGAAIGIDAGAGIGYEFWVNTNWAAYLSGGVDYFLLNGHDDSRNMVTIGFWFGMRYY